MKDANDDSLLPKIGAKVCSPRIFEVEAYEIFMGTFIGKLGLPLSLVLSEHDLVNATVPALAPNEPHSVLHGSISDNMIKRASHTHLSYKADNATVFNQLTITTLGN